MSSANSGFFSIGSKQQPPRLTLPVPPITATYEMGCRITEAVLDVIGEKVNDFTGYPGWLGEGKK